MDDLLPEMGQLMGGRKNRSNTRAMTFKNIIMADEESADPLKLAPTQDLANVVKMIEAIFQQGNSLQSLRIEKLAKLNALFQEVAKLNEIGNEDMPAAHILGLIEIGMEDVEMVENSPDLEQNINLIKIINEIVVKQQYRGTDLDSIKKLKFAMEGCVNLDLEGCMHLDPITRNEIRRANCQIMNETLSHISKKDLNSASYFDSELIKKQPSNLLFMLEFGLLWQTPDLIDSYLKEILVGEPSIKEYLEDLAFNNSLDSSSSDANSLGKSDTESHLPNLLKLLQIILHCLLAKNDAAVESLLLLGKDNRKAAFIFEDPEVCYLLTKGIFELLDAENSALYFGHPKLKHHVNMIAHMLLSVESDHGLTNLCKLAPLKAAPKVKQFQGQLVDDVLFLKNDTMNLVKFIITKENLNLRKAKKQPGEEAITRINSIIERLSFFRKQFDMYERFLIAYDVNRGILWLILTLLAHFDKGLTDNYITSILEFINYSVRKSRPIRDLFYMNTNWVLVQIILEIQPSLCLHLIVDTCIPYLEYHGVLERLLTPLADHLVQGIRFVKDNAEKKLNGNSRNQQTSLFFYQDVFEWMYCMQGLIDILDKLANESSNPSNDIPIKVANKNRTRIELVLKNLIGPCIKHICDVFTTPKLESIVESLKFLQMSTTHYSPLQTSKNLELLIGQVQKLTDNEIFQGHFRGHISEGESRSNVIILELYSYLLKLFNKSILFSGSSGLQYKIPLLDMVSKNSEGDFLSNLEYLRNYKFGYMFLTEILGMYANFFLSEVEEYSAFEFPFAKSSHKNTEETVADKKKHDQENIEGNQEQQNEAENQEPFSFTIMNSLKNLYKTFGISCSIDLSDLRTEKVQNKNKKEFTFIEFITAKMPILERMVQRTNVFQGDMSSEFMTRIYRSYMAKGVLKVIYKLVCSIIYSVPPEYYETTKVFSVIQCLLDNFPVVERFIKPSQPLDIVDLKSFMVDTQKSGNQYNQLKNQINNDVSNALHLLRASKLDSIRNFIENIYKDRNLDEYYNEISEVARESFREMESDKCSELYKNIHLKENNNLRVMIKKIKTFGQDSKEREEDKSKSIAKIIRDLKKDSISERGEIIKCFLLGSEYSKDTYFDNITNWICRQIEEASTQEEIYPGISMILNSDLYSIFHVLDNLMLFSHTIRTKVHSQHEAAIKSNNTYNEGKESRSVISYILSALIHKQKQINSSVFSSNLSLELEFCFVFSFFLSSLTQNNYTPLKLAIGQYKLEGDKQAIPVILSRVALPCLSDEYEKVNRIVMSDRADLVWYNVVCLNLLTECLSGPCTENQNLIETTYKSEYSRLFMICDRVIGSIHNPFYHLQATIAKFLLTIFEGPNPLTVTRLNEYKPKYLYSIITNHLFNLWRFTNKKPGQSKFKKSAMKVNKAKPLKAAKFELSAQQAEPEKAKLRVNTPHDHEEPEDPSPQADEEAQYPDLRSLMELYKTDRSFATNSSIVLARTIFLIMTYAESSNLRRYTTFLNEKRRESEALTYKAPPPKTRPSKNELLSDDTKKLQLLSSIKNLNKEIKQENNYDPLLLLFVFLNNVTGTIEITTKNHESKSNKQVRVVFPILPECLFFSPSKVNRFLETSTVDNQNSRLLELINLSDEILIEIEANINLFNKSHLLSKLITYEGTDVAIWLSWIISLAMNGLWLTSAEITKDNKTETIYERNDIVELVQPSIKITVLVLNITIVCICSFYLAGWLYNSYGVVLKVNKPQVQRQADREGRLKRMFLWTKHYLYDCLILWGQPSILFLHIMFVILYYFGNAIFMTFHLMMFVYHFETTRFIINSVTLHLSKIMTALVFIAFVTYCAAIIIGYHYNNSLLEEFHTKQVMDSWIACATFVFDYGNQGGGGIGDYMLQLPADHPYFFEKIVITIVFFLLVKLIFTNIMLGIIVDTFMELRENQAKHVDKVANECFICGLNRTEFEKRDKPFQFHIKREHQILSYLYYMIYLKKKNVNEFSGTELYVYNLLVKMKRTDWFPFQQTFFLGNLIL